MGRARLVEVDRSLTYPKGLAKVARSTTDYQNEWQPQLVRMDSKNSEKALDQLLAKVDIHDICDVYDEQLAELFLSENAQLYRAPKDIQQASISSYLEDHYAGRPSWQLGTWVYYPWSGQLVHVLDEERFGALRTIRNKELISAEEQAAYAGINVGCAGMSVGSSGAVALVLQGGSHQIKLADGAVISGSNLNRIRTGISSVGLEKSLVIARQLYEMNPYISVDRLGKPVTVDSIQDFFDAPWPLNIVIDEIDDLEVKIRLRVEARKRGLPVLMATDLGDDVMLDVERYDLNPNLPLFHGLAGDIETVLDRTDMTQRQWLKYATQIIGTKNVPLRMQQSLLLVGTKLPTQPQLGGTAMMAGSVLAYAVRMLATNQPLKNGRHVISPDKVLLEGATSLGQKLRHRAHSKALDQAMNSIK
jgi:hypothetical protein